jgi:uncharacterized membrane protein
MIKDRGTPPESEGTPAHEPLIRPSKKSGLMGRLRTYLLAGVIVTAPIGITIWILWAFVNFVDEKVMPLVPDKYNPETYLPFSVPGIGLILLLATLTLIGMTFSGFVGRLYVRIGERIVERMPVVRHLYGALKQILEAVLSQQSGAFREVVLVEYPRRGCWVIGFVTTTSVGEVQNIFAEKMTNVFVPTTPNPTSGFLIFVPRDHIIHLEMTIEQGAKTVISGGIVTPPDPRSPEQRAKEQRTVLGGKPVGQAARTEAMDDAAAESPPELPRE